MIRMFKRLVSIIIVLFLIGMSGVPTFAAKEYPLLSILSRAAASINEEELNVIIGKNTDYGTKEFAFVEFVYSHPFLIVGTFLLFILLVCFILLAQRRNAKTKLEYQTKLLKATEIDPITGLYTKEAFYRELRLQLDANPNKHYVIVRWDLDNFKVYNDIFGPTEGDRVLIHAGEGLRSDKHIVGAHLEADHFAFCEEARLIDEEQIMVKISERLRKHNASYQFTPRFGAYRIEDPTLDVRLMCDRALYALRSSKGNAISTFVWYDDSMRKAAAEEQSLLAEIMHALENDEFGIYLQPQIDQYTGEVIGAEALARWFHPQNGVITPDVFLSIMESNGLISQLDKIIWEKAAAFLAKCNKAGKTGVAISVNMSRLDIYEPKLLHRLGSLVQKFGIERWQLHFEITESAYTRNPEQLIEVVREIRNAGFKVEMDDFGSGQSSLNTLRNVPVDTLKLDMKFLSDAENDTSGGGIILNSVIRMANWLGLHIIAEGVETQAQADYLKSIGCRFVQGYLYAKPMPTAEYFTFLDKNRCAEEQRSLAVENYFNGIDFWNPSSQESLIFNTLIGAASIYEYSNGMLCSIRVNEAFIRAVEMECNKDVLLKANALEYVLDEDRSIVMIALETASHTTQDTEFEARWRQYKKPGQFLWLRFRLRRIAKSTNTVIFYASVENTSEKRISEQRQKDLLEKLHTENEQSKAIIQRSGVVLFQYSVLTDEFYYQISLDFDQVLDEIISGYVKDLPNASFIHPADRTLVYSHWRSIIEQPHKGSFECRMMRYEENPTVFLWKRFYYAPVFDNDGALVKIIGQIDDIQQEMDRKEQIKRLTAQIGSMDMVDSEVTNRVFQKLSESHNLQETIGAVLAALGQHFNVSRVYIIEEDATRTECTNTYEWCNEHVVSGKEHVQRFSHDIMGGRKNYLACFGENTTYAVSDVRTLRPEARRILDPQDIQAMLWSRLYRDKDVLSYIGLDDCTGPRVWTPIVIGTLAMVSKLIGTFLEKERDRNEAAMAEDELRAAMEKLGKNICRYDIATRTIVRSKAHAESIGLPEVSSGIPFSTIKLVKMDPNCETAKRYIAFYDAIHRGEPSGSEELAFIKPDGSTIWQRTEFVTIFDKEGNPDRAILAVEDVTEQHTEKRMLLKERERLLSAVESAYFVVLSLNLTKNTFVKLYVNESLPISPPDCGSYDEINDLCISQMAEDQRAALKEITSREALMEAYHRGEEKVCFETYQFGSDEVWHWRETTVYFITDEEYPNEISAILLARPIDEQKLLEKKLQQALAATSDELAGERFNMKLVNDNMLIETLIYRQEDKAISFLGGNLLPSYGYTDEDIASFHVNGLSNLIVEDDFNDLIALHASHKALHGKSFEMECRVKKKNGKIAWIISKFSLTTALDGEQVYVGTFSDITKRKNMEAELRRSEEIMRLISKLSDCVVHYYDFESRTVRAVDSERMAKQHFPVWYEQVPEAFVENGFVCPESLTEFERFFSEMRQGKPNGQVKLKLMLVENAGEHWYDSRFMSLYDSDGQAYAAVISYLDITKEQQQLYQAEIDGMTGIYNRATAERMIQAYLESQLPVPECLFLIIDLDNLKEINDTFGHTQGYISLKMVAKTLKEHFRNNDIVGRLGGDEFLVLLRGISHENRMDKLFRSLLQSMEEIQLLEGVDTPVSVSIGAAHTDTNAKDFDTLYKNADKALYFVKQHGKNSYAIYSEEMG